MSNQKLNSTTWTWSTPCSFKRADLAILEAIESNQDDSTPAFEITRSQLKRLFEEGLVSADLIPIKANSKLKSGSKISVTLPAPQPSSLIPESMPLEILFEDEHLLVINKSQGLTVHPSPTQMTGTLVHGLLHHIQNLSGIGGTLRPGIVHRIDKNTSGSLVITKSDSAHLRLAQIFARHEIERTYWALCYGTTPGSETDKPTLISSLIGRNPTDRKKMSMQVTTGKKALTHFRKIKEFGLPSKKPFASWIEATLETGRTHQVRVHLTGIGNSIFGDPTYGTPTEKQPKWLALPQSIQKIVKKLPGQALHARVLGFKHPMTGEALRFEAPVPPLFQEILSALENYEGKRELLE